MGPVLLNYAQVKYTVTPFTAREGLISSEIITLFQDSRKYLWIGHSAGVSRFDGYQFDNYLSTVFKHLGKTYCIAEDSQQNVWIGAENGLFLYANQQLTAIDLDKNERPVYALRFDKKGGLWIGSSDGPAYLQKEVVDRTVIHHRLPLRQYILPAWKQKFPAGNCVYRLSVGSDNSVYFGAGYALYTYTKNNLISLWATDAQDDKLKGIVAVNKDTVFMCSARGSILALENGHYRRSLSATGRCSALIEKDGSLLCYATGGVYTINRTTLYAERIFEIPQYMKPWGSCFLRDNENNFWLGTHENLCYARADMFTALQQPLTVGFDDLYCIDTLQDGSMICGANRGTVFTAGKNTTAFNKWKKIFPRAQVTDVFQGQNNETWFSSWYQGLALFEKGGFHYFTKKEGLRDNSNFLFCRNVYGEIFTAGDDGVSKISRNAQGRVYFTNYDFQTGSADFVVIKSAIALANGSVLFGSNHGLLELKNDSLQRAVIQNGLARSYNITDMRCDTAGNIWISTIGDGILLCSVNNNGRLALEKQFNKNNGLSSPVYLQLLTDRAGMVWAAEYNGLTCIQATANKEFYISNYGHHHGFIQESFHSIKMMQDASGIIWIATSSGLMKFDPQAINDTLSPVVQLTDIRFPGHSSAPAKNTQPVVLPHYINSIAFHYTSIHFSDPAAISYSYRLVGLDSTWVKTGTNRLAGFQQLPPGDYIFQVKAVAANNRQSDIISYHFVINPPFWLHWWFMASCAVILILAGTLIVKNKVSSIKRKAKAQSKIQEFVSENLKYRLEIEQVISYFAASMSRKLTADEILWDIARNCIAQLGFEDCVIYLKDETRNVLLQKAACGPKTNNQDVIINPIEIPIGKGIVGYVASTGVAEIVNDTTNDPRYIVDDKRRLSEIAVPIMEAGMVIGVIDSEHAEKGFYTDRHLQILTTIASLCADKLAVMKAATERQQAQLEAIRNKQKATEARFQSTRLQMNPHFIFNALNSIQQMILAGTEATATRCLSKFSRLLRLVLMHSDKDKITLAEELETLHLYISLESMRFKDRFEYQITCEEAIDEEEAMIPPLLIQPFVENAIWHGFMHKDGTHKLRIHFREAPNDMLICVIEDNGIGRAASQTIRQQQDYTQIHSGKGIQVTAERLKIFSESAGEGCSLEITDLKDDFGKDSGTRVTIQFPAY